MQSAFSDLVACSPPTLQEILSSLSRIWPPATAPLALLQPCGTKTLVPGVTTFQQSRLDFDCHERQGKTYGVCRAVRFRR